jgi:hypothetical protein
MRHGQLLLLAGMALSVSACESSTEPERITLSIRGIVTSAATGEPLTGASVSLMEWGIADYYSVASAQTGQDGRYSLSYTVQGWACGSFYYLWASCPGYVGNWPSTDFTCTSAAQQIDIQLEPQPQPNEVGQGR